MKDRSFLDYIYLFIKGAAMGTANKVPGVSGGMVALVSGFYEEFIYSLQKFNSKAWKLLLAKKYKLFFKYINSKFLLAVILGSLFSYFTISKLLDYLIIHYEIPVWSFFFGMIIGSVYYINKEIDIWTSRAISTLVLGLIIGFGISFMDPIPENRNLIFIFICGIISVSGMTLPGLSGSFILMILGNYSMLLIDSVNSLSVAIYNTITLDFRFLQNPEIMENVKMLLVFTLGSIVGMISLSKLLGYLLKHYHRSVITLLMGFIIGSLGNVWPWKTTIYKTFDDGNFVFNKAGKKIIESYDRYLPNISSNNFITDFVFILLGIILILLLDYYTHKKTTAQG